jgi:nucleotide-binding universal stress UspA family protein
MWIYPPARILSPVDFGEASARALKIAGALASTYGARLTVLHADTLEAPLYFTSSQVRALEKQRAASQQNAERLMHTFASRQVEDGRTEYVIAEGAPAPAIIQAARRADLVVMGTHGRRGPARWWAGSVAERVVREVDVPVLVVRAAGQTSLNAIFKRLAVVSPDGAFDGPARRYARGLAATFGGDVVDEDAASTKIVGEASILILARPAERGIMPGSAAADLLRTCRRPVLFVPGV